MAIALSGKKGFSEEAKAKKVMEDLENELHLIAMEYDLERFEYNNK